MNLSEELLKLKFKKARIILEIESLSTVNDSVFINLVKTVYDIVKIEKQNRSELKNIFDEN